MIGENEKNVVHFKTMPTNYYYHYGEFFNGETYNDDRQSQVSAIQLVWKTTK